MKFVLKHSLEHMALVKIVVSLWNQIDVRDLMMKRSSQSYFTARDEQWKEIEERVTEKVPLLLLPQLLKEKVLGYIRPIGLEISMWKEYNHKHFHVYLPAELYWTPQGTVDRKRTAKVLVSDVNLDISTRYELSCFYCLEDDILKFWNKMPRDLKESISPKFQIISFWSRNMKKRELGDSHIDYKDQFCKSVYWNNRVAAEYFLQKLTVCEIEESLENVAKNVTDGDLLYFLLSEMYEEQQMEVFKNNPYGVLQCFLQWPLQSFFIGVASCMWDYISKLDYYCLLQLIVQKVKEGYNDWNYQKLFREFWHKSPNVQKCLDSIDKSLLLLSLFDIKDKENIRLILNDANVTVKEKLIYNYRTNLFCQLSIHYDEWNFLEFFIREFLPSKNEMLKFKEEFEKRIFFKDCSPTKKQKWNQLFFISDDSTCKYVIRSVEGGEISSCKKFRRLQ